jgi:hypothetical protein
LANIGNLVDNLPEGPERDELLELVRIGLTFRAQQVGRRPGPLARLVQTCAQRAGTPCTFDQLLEELEREAARRTLQGEKASPVEKVDRIWQQAIIHLPKRGRAHIPFGTLRNHLTKARKIFSPRPFTPPAKP